MDKITFGNFTSVMFSDITERTDGIEIWFCVDDNQDYYSCWLGKMIDKQTNSVCYWFGLVEDGSQAYDFDSFEQFVNANVFNGKSIKDIWDSVSLLSIDACDVQQRLPFYLG